MNVYLTYPIEPRNRLPEPTGAANVATVGALAVGSGFGGQRLQDADVRPMTQKQGEPSPVTRVGPRANDARKPGVVDLDGTAIFGVSFTILTGAPHLPAAGGHHAEPSVYQAVSHRGRGGRSFAAPRLIHKPRSATSDVRRVCQSPTRAPRRRDMFAQGLRTMLESDDRRRARQGRRK